MPKVYDYDYDCREIEAEIQQNLSDREHIREALYSVTWALQELSQVDNPYAVAVIPKLEATNRDLTGTLLLLTQNDEVGLEDQAAMSYADCGNKG